MKGKKLIVLEVEKRKDITYRLANPYFISYRCIDDNYDERWYKEYDLDIGEKNEENN